jgi:hypothetical protein
MINYNKTIILVALGGCIAAGLVGVLGTLQGSRAKVATMLPTPTASALEPTCGMPPGPDGSRPALVRVESAIAPWQFIGFEESQVGYGVGGKVKQRVISLTDLMPLKCPACLIRSTLIIANVDDDGRTTAETSAGVSIQRVEDCTDIRPSVPERPQFSEDELPDEDDYAGGSL